MFGPYPSIDQNVRIAVLSDIHLGAKDGLDRFARTKHAEHNLLTTLRELEKEVDRIILLGDIFETLRGVIPGTRAEELKKGLAAYPEIARRILDDARYTYIFGNHDYVANRVLGAPEFYAVETHGQRALFFHGHQADWISKGEARLSRAALWGTGMLERAGVSVTQWVDKHRSAHPADDGADNKPARVWWVESQALALGKSMGADIVVNGHTHRAIKHEGESQLYLNSGTCLCGHREYVLLDMESNRYEIVQLGSDPVEVPATSSEDSLQVA